MTKSRKRNVILIVIACVLAACIALFAITLSTAGSSATALKGVMVEGIDIGGMNKEEAQAKLDSDLNEALEQQTITANFADQKLDIQKADAIAGFNIEDCVNEALAVGHDENIFSRFFHIWKAKLSGIDLPISSSYDADKIKKTVRPFVKKINGAVKDFSYNLDYEQNKLTLYSGKSVEGLNIDEVVKAVGEAVVDKQDSVELKGETIVPKTIPYKKLVKKVSSDGQNATLKVGEDGKSYEFVEELDKITVDMDRLEEAYDSVVGKEDESVTIDVEAQKADVTLEDLKKKLFKDKLSTYTTTFSTSTTTGANRRTNMVLASKSINDYVIAPGQKFSFNDICGPRNAQTGYKIAGAYRDGQVTSEYGGGICQCSSTLYNCVLLADLQVNYRKNHTFTVPYVPVGRDATVSHPEVDFTWTNNYNYPIKVKASVASNSITVSLYGTIEDKSKSVEISSEILSTKPMATTYKYGSQYSESGTLISSGHTGYVARSYKTIKKNGKVVSKTTIATSYYTMLNQVIGKKNKPKAKATSGKAAGSKKDAKSRKKQG